MGSGEHVVRDARLQEAPGEEVFRLSRIQILVSRVILSLCLCGSVERHARAMVEYCIAQRGGAVLRQEHCHVQHFL